MPTPTGSTDSQGRPIVEMDNGRYAVDTGQSGFGKYEFISNAEAQAAGVDAGGSSSSSSGSDFGDRQPRADRRPGQGVEFDTPVDDPTTVDTQELVGKYAGTRQELPSGEVRTSPAGEPTPDQPPKEEQPSDGQGNSGGGGS